MKKPRKTLYDESWNDCCINSLEESDEDDVQMLEKANRNGEKLSRLGPNRFAAIREETEKPFAQDNTYAWPEIKKKSVEWSTITCVSFGKE